MPKISAALVQGDADCVSAEVPRVLGGFERLEAAPCVLVFGCDFGSAPLHESGDLDQGGGHLVGAGVDRAGAGPAGGSEAVVYCRSGRSTASSACRGPRAGWGRWTDRVGGATVCAAALSWLAGHRLHLRNQTMAEKKIFLGVRISTRGSGRARPNTAR